MRGLLNKMRVEHNTPVDYYLRLGDDEVHLNPHIGQHVTLTYTGRIACQNCARITKKSYSQGYCYPCFKKLAQCDLCVMSPDRCHHAQGTCRDENFAQTFCMQPHLVYLANSSGVKVGITKPENLPIRWIDQGAVQALPIYRVETRQQAGLVEVACKAHISDRTQWQQMLKAEDVHVDLTDYRDRLLALVDTTAITSAFGDHSVTPLADESPLQFQYPVEQYPTKVTALNFDKTPEVTGTLLGIKGQYLIFDIGVINIRKFTSYEVAFSAKHPSSAATGQLSLL